MKTQTKNRINKACEQALSAVKNEFPFHIVTNEMEQLIKDIQFIIKSEKNENNS